MSSKNPNNFNLSSQKPLKRYVKACDRKKKMETYYNVEYVEK